MRIPREGGRFFWKQFCTATELGCDMGYVAMFDEGTRMLLHQRPLDPNLP